MANETISPNMNLPIPVVSVAPGPTYASDVNGCLTIVDAHDHSPGSGVQITPNGLNINSSLSFGGNLGTSLKGIVFTPQSSLSSLNAIYSIGADLYYNDSASNVIRITSGGTVNATSSGISSGSASASFQGGVLVVESAPTFPASIEVADVLFGDSGSTLQLGPPTLSSSYAIVLPNLPSGGTKFVSIDVSGNMASTLDVDNSTLAISSNLIQVKDGGITPQKLSALGQQVSASSGNFVTSSTSFVDVTNLSRTITTTGRPVKIGLQSDGTGTTSNMTAFGTSLALAIYQIVRDSTVISVQEIGYNQTGVSSGSVAQMSSIVSHVDVIAAGTYTYKIQAKILSGTSTSVNASKLIVYEL